MMEAHVVDFIQSHESESPIQIRQAVRDALGVEMSPVAILQILNDGKRRDNINQARTSASERLSHKVDLTEEIIQAYVDMVKDDTLDLKERLMAMRDLRGWIKLSMDAAGDAGPATDQIFAISKEWDLGFGPN